MWHCENSRCCLTKNLSVKITVMGSFNISSIPPTPLSIWTHPVKRLQGRVSHGCHLCSQSVFHFTETKQCTETCDFPCLCRLDYISTAAPLRIRNRPLHHTGACVTMLGHLHRLVHMCIHRNWTVPAPIMGLELINSCPQRNKSTGPCTLSLQ